MLWALFFWILLAIKVFALGDAAIRKNSDYELRSNTLPKNGWLLLLGLAVVTQFFGLLTLVGLVVALVYLAQFRGSTV